MRLLLIAVLSLFLAAGAAHAHAIIMESAPAKNATVTGPDIAIHLRYNSRIDAKRSAIRLIGQDKQEKILPMCDGGGSQLALGTSVLTPACSDDTLVTHITGLSPGSYKLRWQVLSVDGHITRGDIPFTDTAQ